MTISSGREGRHLLTDLFGCTHLDDLSLIEETMREATAAAGATLIGIHLHHFGDGQGVTGVALLAESHMSIHTWPEYGYAALDIFLCGMQHDIEAPCDLFAFRLSAQKVSNRLISRGEMVDVPVTGLSR